MEFQGLNPTFGQAAQMPGAPGRRPAPRFSVMVKKAQATATSAGYTAANGGVDLMAGVNATPLPPGKNFDLDAEEHLDEDTAVDRRSEEDRFMDEIRVAKNCLRCFNIAMLIVGSALSIVAFIGGSTVMMLQWIPYAVSGVGFAIVCTTLLGLFGVIKSRASKTLTAFYTLLVFGALALLILGGFCMILTETAVESVATQWDEILANVPPEDRASLTLDEVRTNLRLYMYITGSVCLVLVLMILMAMGSVVRLVTPVKAYTVLLQATNIALMPFGVALISVAAFLADTTGTVEPFAAFSVFVMGVLVICLTALGFTGTALHSRGLIRLFTILIGILAVLFLAFGTTSLVIASTVEQYLTDRWETIRRVLPPTFSGKYDQEQFQAFVSSNLRMLGFMALCAGLTFGIQVWGARRLRQELRTRAELEDRMDELYNELQRAWTDVRDAIYALKHAHRGARKAGVTGDILRSRMRRLQTHETSRLDTIRKQAETREEDVAAALAADPPRNPAEDVTEELYALRVAVYHRLRTRSHMRDVEHELDLLDGRVRRKLGVHGVKTKEEKRAEAAAEEAVSSTLAMSASGDESMLVGMSDTADLDIRPRPMRHINACRLFWKQQWTKGTTKTRRLIICACVCCVSLIAIVLGVSVAALYYSTSCVSLSEAPNAFLYDAYDPDAEYNEASDPDAPTATPLSSHFFAVHNVTRGQVRLLIDDEVTTPVIRYEKGAFKKSFAAAGQPVLEYNPSTDAYGLVAVEAPPTKLMSFDVSCQFANIEFRVPPATENSLAASRATLTHPSGFGNSGGVLDVDMSGRLAGTSLDFEDVDVAHIPRLRRVNFATSGGPIELRYALLGAEGASLRSELGEILLEHVDAHCDEAFLQTEGMGVSVLTEKGTISVDSSAFLDCDVTLRGDASLVRLAYSTVRSSKGGGLVTLFGNKGLMQVDHSSIEVLDVKGSEGSVRSQSLNITETLRIATVQGGVRLTDLRVAPRGVVQIETDNGDVIINAAGFAGILSIVTGGDVTCTGDGFDTVTVNGNPVPPCTPESGRTDGLSVVERVKVNCARSATRPRDDCPYLGEMTITSKFGNVILTMAAWDRVS